jgi:competence ComEA-like helix-hairpin-helix protein
MEPSSKLAALGVTVACMAIVALGNMQWTGQTRSIALSQNGDSNSAPTKAQASARTVRALQEGVRLDLNTATSADLELLPAIGPKLSARIVAYRNRHGWFSSVEGLLQVSGIGARKLERIKPLIYVATAKQSEGHKTKYNDHSNLQIKNKVACEHCSQIPGLGVERREHQEGPHLQTQEKPPREQVVDTDNTVNTRVESQLIFSKGSESVESRAEEGDYFYNIY